MLQNFDNNDSVFERADNLCLRKIVLNTVSKNSYLKVEITDYTAILKLHVPSNVNFQDVAGELLKYGGLYVDPPVGPADLLRTGGWLHPVGRSALRRVTST
jgi:hypothetical protein